MKTPPKTLKHTKRHTKTLNIQGTCIKALKYTSTKGARGEEGSKNTATKTERTANKYNKTLKNNNQHKKLTYKI